MTTTPTTTRAHLTVDCWNTAHLNASDMFADFLRRELESSDMRCTDGYIPCGPYKVVLLNYPRSHGPRRMTLTVGCDLLHDDPVDDDHRVRTELDLALVFDWPRALRVGRELIVDVDLEAA